MKKNFSFVSPSKMMLGAALLACTFQSCESPEEAVTPLDATASAPVQGTPIAGKYIVVLKKDNTRRMPEQATYAQRQSQARSRGQQILRERGIAEQALGHAYGKVLEGFSADLSRPLR